MRLPRSAIIAIGAILPAFVLVLIVATELGAHATIQQHIDLSGSTMSKTRTKPNTIAGTPTLTTTIISTSGNQPIQPKDPTSEHIHTSATPATQATHPSDSSTPTAPTVTLTQPQDSNQPSNNDTTSLIVPYLTSYTKMSRMVPDPEKGTDWYFNQCSATWNDGHTQTWNIGPPAYYPSGITGTVSCGAPPAS